jgi:putative ABC transport system permease protein
MREGASEPSRPGGSSEGKVKGSLQMSDRLLLRAYPRWFRDEFGIQLEQHLIRQRAERRYGARGLGVARFWWDAGTDAVVTGVKLRLGRALERLSSFRRRRRAGPGGDRDGRERGGAGTMLEAIVRDVRHAMRGLTRNPGYTLVFVVTLGLGIGANTAMFSAVNGVLLRPLPHADGDRLVYLRHSARLAGIENALFSVPEIDDYRQRSRSLAAVAEFSAMDFTILGDGAPRRVRAGIVTGNYFDVMGLSATLGRTVGRGDDGSDAPAVIVLSNAYWRNVLGGDPDVLGRTVEMNGRTATIVGVAQPAPPYPERTDIYVNMATSPHHLDATMKHDRSHRMTEVFAKLASGATVESARTEVSAITSQVHAEHAESYDPGAGFEVTVTLLKTQLTARARPTLLLLLGTAFFVLIIACANLANLTLTRVLRRDHELAVRVSLGGSRGALRRELLVESLVLASVGAALGVLMASVSLDLLVAFAERFTSRASEIALDPAVFGFALTAAVVSSVFFAIVPPLPDGDSGALTRSGIRSTAGSRARRAQRALVVAQIGTSFVLLIGAGLLVRTMMHLNRVDPGFDTAQVLSMDVPVEFDVAAEAAIRERFLATLADVRALPGVESAALTSSIPLGSGGIFSGQLRMAVDGHEPATGAPSPRAVFRVVSPGYLETMGIELIRGRDFTTTDVEDSQEVVIINESMARAYFGERDPIGQRLAWTDETMRFMGEDTEWRPIVGVVSDTRERGLDAEVAHTVYNPYRQITPFFTTSLVIRVSGDAETIVPSVREAILAYDANQPIINVATIAELGSDSVAPRRLNAMLLGGFALLALVIAAVGIAGVLAYSVGSRTREFGVMSALGAARHQIWSGVLVEGARLAAFGIVLGSVAAVLLTRFISELLVGVQALDPVTFVGVGVLLGAVAVLAAWTPAWRAAEVSPMEALGSE